MLLNCGAGEDFWKSLGLQGDQTSQFERKSTLILFGGTDAETEAPILWAPDMKSQLIGKDPDAGKDWRQEKGVTEVRWLDGITDSVDMSLSKLQEIVKEREAQRAVVHGVSKNWTWLSDWTTIVEAMWY